MPEGYETYRLMKLFGLHHPDQADELPSGFAMWAFEFQRVEQEAQAELQKDSAKKAQR